MTPHQTSTGQMRRVMTAQLDALGVPDGVLRTAVGALLDVVDAPGRPGDLPIALRALDLMQVEMLDLYSPSRTVDSSAATKANHPEVI